MKTLRIALIAVTLVAGLAMLGGAMPVARAAALTVDNSGTCDDVTGSPAYCTIQAAINAGNPGDLINVAAGTYAEAVTIAKPLTLACANAGVPVADRTAGSPTETIIDLSGNYSGMVIQTDGITIDGCDIVGDAATNHGIYVAAGANSLSTINILNNFIHGMAKENTGTSPRSYGILADAKAAGPAYGTIGALLIAGNEIYDIGGTSTAGGLGISLDEIVGDDAGDGVEITGNVVHDIQDDTGGLTAFGTAVSVSANAGANSGLGGPSTGALVTGNAYSDSSVGVSVYADDSAVSEAHDDFGNVPLMVVNLSAPATTAEIDEPALAPYAKSNKLTVFEPLFPGSEGYWVTIQGAINASDPGATVTVTDGTFNENVVVDRSLTLAAESGAHPIVDGDTDGDSAPDGNVVTIITDAVTIDGFEIRNGYNGIAGETSTSNIVNNVVHDNLNIGILLWGDNDQNLIGGNEIFNNDRLGILLGFSDDTKVSNDNMIESNTIYDNALYGIQLRNADGGVIERNQIFGHDGLSISQGIYLEASDGNAIFDNDVYDNSYGVSVNLGSADTYLAGNTIHDNQLNGLTISDAGSASTLVNFNQFCRNMQYGVKNLGIGKGIGKLDATFNWWGSASGPGPLGPGTGDSVSSGVNFWPWDNVPPTDGPCHINSIHAQKYQDLDHSGDRNDDEPGLNGWLLTLYDIEGQEVINDTTHTVGYEDGWALFEGVAPGTYTVCETLQYDWLNSDPGSTPPCKSVAVADEGRNPGSGPLVTLIVHPGGSKVRLDYLGIDTWELDLDTIDLPHLLPRLSEPWLCLLNMLVEPDPELLQEEIQALDPGSLMDWNPADGFDNGLFYITLENPHLNGPARLGIKTWRGAAGYSLATVFIECGCGVPTVLFGNYEEEPTAISLASFTAEPGANGVILSWETGTEIDNAGFNLYRAVSPDGPYAKINGTLIAARGDPASGASYSFLDMPGDGTFYYRLEDVDYYGISTLHGPIQVTLAPPFRRPLHRPMSPQ